MAVGSRQTYFAPATVRNEARDAVTGPIHGGHHDDTGPHSDTDSDVHLSTSGDITAATGRSTGDQAAGAAAVCVRSIHLMANGTAAEFATVFHPQARNREAAAEPPATRGCGATAFYATALWLRTAYSDLAFEIHDTVVDGDRVVLHTTMSGWHTGTFVSYDADARPAQAFPPTGRQFAITQTHWFRLVDGMVIEHWANRDDLGQAMQLGWTPPKPLYLLRMARATRRARREAGHT